VEDLVRSELVEPHGQRCADCGVVLEKAENQSAVCLECGEPLCHDCASQHLKLDEPMVCATCWERDTLTAEEE
jgi:predicted amidophosphoribosyltransferase